MNALLYFSAAVLIATLAFFAGVAYEDTGLNPCLRADVTEDQQFNVLGGYVVCDGRGLVPLP